MDGLLRVRLEAHNPGRNHHRWYEVRLGRDLFGHWVVTIGYGRAGFGGHTLTYSDADPTVVRDIIRHHLDRRSSARGGSGASTGSAPFRSRRGFGLKIGCRRPPGLANGGSVHRVPAGEPDEAGGPEVTANAIGPFGPSPGRTSTS